MFAKLTENIGNVFNKLKGRAVLRAEDIDAAMREIRIALLEADVALPVVKDFIAKVKEKALGEEVVKSIQPAQMVVKIVNDELTDILGGNEDNELNLNAKPPVVILMCGLQGSGKTTSCGKLALNLKNKQNKKVMLASLDIYRPAAQKQLEILAGQAGVGSLPIIDGQKPEDIAKRAMKEADLGGYDILIVDTAGRLHIDENLMGELKNVYDIVNPTEVLLAVDAMTGQDAVNVAREFNEKIGVTGIVLTRIDGDARGGAALSMRAITGRPIKFVGVGEKISEFEKFDASRMAGRILDMGDIVSLVEKAQENFDADENEKMMKRMKSGVFDLTDYYKQIKSIQKMGGMGSLMGMIPGVAKFKDKIEEAGVDKKVFKRQLAIIDSMTPNERRFPKLLNAKRKVRVAKGSGTEVSEINQLLKQHQQMEKMMKKMKGMNPKNLASMAGMKNLFG